MGVYEALAASYDRLTSDVDYGAIVAFYEEILKKEGNVGYAISTIYRILATFEEMHFVEKSNFIGDGTVVYEWNKGSHTHYAICLQCHKKVALQVCPFEDLHLHGEAKDFVVTGHKLELYGYCKECEKKKIKKITKN